LSEEIFADGLVNLLGVPELRGAHFVNYRAQ